MATNVVGSNLKAPKFTLKDLNQANPDDTKVSLQDLAPSITASPAVVNTPSNLNNAAYASMLNTESDMVNTYRSVLSEGEQYGTSPTASAVVSKAATSAQQSYQPSLVDMMADPSVSDQDRMAAVQKVYGKDTELYSPSNLLAMKAFDAPSESQDSTPEASHQRFSTGAVIEGINKRNAQIQQIYNSVKTQVDPGIASKAYNFITSLLPGVSEFDRASIMTSTGQGSFTKNFLRAFTFAGGNNQSIATYLDNMTPEDAVVAASHMADVLANHDNPVIFGPDAEARREVLDLALSGNGYGTADKIKDSLGGWADATIIGGPIVKLISKAAKGSAEAADVAAQAAKATEAEAKDTSSVVDVEATHVDPNPPAPPKTTKTPNSDSGSLGQFYRSRERLVYDSSNGIPYRNNPENVLSSAIRDALRSDVQPISVFQNVKNVNHDMARAIYDDLTNSASDSVAKAATGAPRSEALASPVLPELEHEDGSVAAKVSFPDAVQRTREALPAELVDYFKHDGLTQFDQNEKAMTRAWMLNNFQNAIGMTPRSEMFQMLPDMTKYVDTPQGFSFRGVYGPADGGFSDASQAIETAKFALRNTGIDESALGLLRRDGEQYVPTTLEEASKSDGKDYLVTVDHDYRINSVDVDRADKAAKAGGQLPGSLGIELPDGRVWSKLSVKRNWTDGKMLGNGSTGKLSNYVFDFGSQLHSTIYLGALQGADKAASVEKALLKQVDDFAKGWKGLSKEKQVNLLDEIHSANSTSRDYDYTSLSAKGFSAEDMDVLNKFKIIQDSNWYLRNRFLAGQLDKAGYEEFVHGDSLTNLPARRVSRGSINGDVKYYDPQSGTAMVKKAADLDALYEHGGGVARLKQPITLADGNVVEHVIHTRNPSDGYLRTFTPNSKVLNYRPGYAQIRYTDPYYVIRKVNGGLGKPGGYEQAVSTAKDMVEAKTIAGRLSVQGDEHYFRPAREMLNSEGGSTHDVDLSIAEGMSAFRHRGKMLMDSNSPTTNLAMAHIQNPVESLVNGAVSLSRKIVMSDIIDSIKRRAISYYSDLLPKNEFHEPLVPKDLRDIRYRGGVNYDPKAIRDARATFAYAHMLESGYVNLLDDGVKAALNTVADTFGQLGLGKLERGARALSEKSLTNGAKSGVYHAYIGLSPLRQAVVQGQQAVLTAAINPRWVVTKEAFGQPAYLALRTMGLGEDHALVKQAAKMAWGSDSEEVYKQFQRSGLVAAIDHNNFVSGAVNDLAKNMINNSKQTFGSKLLAGPRAVSRWSRKIGFDAGEFYSNAMTWAAHRDLAAQKGLDVFADDVADKLAAQTRNYQGAMNYAGDLPTNKNALSLVFQFTQNSQKMFLNSLTNRSIDAAVRNRLKLLGVALYGLPTYITYNYLNSVQDPNAKEILSQGIEGWMLNKMLSEASGEKSEIDWSGLSPFNAYGTLDAIKTMWTGTPGDVLAKMPSTSLLFGSNPRVVNAISSLARYTNLADDDPDSPETFLQVVSDFAKLSSGYSAMLKAKVLLDTHKKISSAGTVTEENKDSVNAIGVALGFGTINEAQEYYIQNLVRDQKQERQNDVRNYYNMLKQKYSDTLYTDEQLTYTQKVLNQALRHFGDDPYARNQLRLLMESDLKNGEAGMFNSALRNCPLFKNGDCIKLIENTPFDNPQDKENLKSLINSGNQFQPDN